MGYAGSVRTVLVVGIPLLVLLCIPLIGIGCPSTNPGVPYTSAISAYEVAEGVQIAFPGTQNQLAVVGRRHL